jgi:hypothetical protein
MAHQYRRHRSDEWGHSLGPGEFLEPVIGELVRYTGGINGEEDRPGEKSEDKENDHEQANEAKEHVPGMQS